MQTYSPNATETIVELPARLFHGIKALETYVAKLSPESANATFIGEQHVRTHFAGEDITLEIELSRKDSTTDEIMVYGWNHEGLNVNLAESVTAQALIEHLEKLRG